MFSIGDFIEEKEYNTGLHVITDIDTKKNIYLVDNKEWYSEKDVNTIYKKSMPLKDYNKNITRLNVLSKNLPKWKEQSKCLKN